MADTQDPQARALHALALHQRGEVAQARAIYREVLAQAPDHAELLLLAGMAAVHMRDFAEAVALLGRSTAAGPSNSEAWFNYGVALINLGRYAQALASLDKAVALNPSHADTHSNRAVVLRALGRHEDALAAYDKALALNPQSAHTLSNRAVTLSDLGRYADAVASCDRAIALDPRYPAPHNNRGIALRALGRHTDALASFSAAIALNPGDAEAFNNRGFIHATLHQYQAALSDYTRALALQPTYAEALNNRANCLMEMRDHAGALADYQQAIALKPDYAEAYANFGHFLSEIGKFDKALASFRKALQLNPDAPFVQGYILYMRMMNSDWQGIEAEVTETCGRIAEGHKVIAPFPALVITDDPALQNKATALWAHTKYPHSAAAPPLAEDSGKIRVAYFSMDFREHPIATLTAGIYEAHDREKFEVYGFSYGPDTNDPIRARLKQAFDKFIDVREMSDAEIVALARGMKIDIAVDLAGYTKSARTDIFAARAAPLQIGYLGFPGTMAVPYMDYIIGDEIAIPPQARAHYSEKVLYLPTFQSNDDKRERPSRTFSRAELGLPPTGFVFCCFNNTYKFTPQVFAAWMRILKRVANSVLFLYAAPGPAADNLRRAAAAHGIAPERLVFGTRLDMAGYLARYKAADLFLDTLPYNAGTTAADALWMGLPVLTCAGGALASRMAASLLHAVDLPELVTSSLEEYEDRAVALATQGNELAAIKNKLARHGTTARLFNTLAFTRNLEDAYMQMVARARAGLAPDHIFAK